MLGLEQALKEARKVSAALEGNVRQFSPRLILLLGLAVFLTSCLGGLAGIWLGGFIVAGA